jgi:hypothetical protein
MEQNDRVGFEKAVRVLKQLTAVPGSSRFDAAFDCLYAEMAIDEIAESPVPEGGVPADAATSEELQERLSRLEEIIAQEGALPALLREKVDLYYRLFNVPCGFPRDMTDSYFSDFLRCASLLAAVPGSLPGISRIAGEMCLRYADHCRRSMSAFNNEAEKNARRLVVSDDRESELFRIQASVRSAIASGARAAAVLAWAREPRWVSENLYAGFEKRADESYRIDEGCLEEMSADGKAARVRVDRRHVVLRSLLDELCRAYVRIGAFEKAKTCERLRDTLAIGYSSKNISPLVDFEEAIWNNILNRAATSIEL